MDWVRVGCRYWDVRSEEWTLWVIAPDLDSVWRTTPKISGDESNAAGRAWRLLFFWNILVVSRRKGGNEASPSMRHEVHEFDWKTAGSSLVDP